MTPRIIIHTTWPDVQGTLGFAQFYLISLNEVFSTTLLNIFWLGDNLFGKFLQWLKNTEEIHISKIGID